MRVNVLILNYNGCSLLAECLPSVLRAAAASRFDCRVAVIDNSSTDGSIIWLKEHFPNIDVIRRPNRGLCSFNEVVAALEGPVAILLNNDIKLDRDCIDPLVETVASDSRCFMAAPKCWLFGGRSYEGFRTAVGWRWGLIQATALFPGYQQMINQPGLTASAGAAMAVDSQAFVELGGFDPIYLPGRLEDLDFAFCGFMSGRHARYVPNSVVYHRGMATFGAIFGSAGCDQLAIRNTLLFQWKNLRHPLHMVRHIATLPLRILYDLGRSPFVSARRRFAFTRALLSALSRRRSIRRFRHHILGTLKRERKFFELFHPRQMKKVSAEATRGSFPHTYRPLLPTHDRQKYWPDSLWPKQLLTKSGNRESVLISSAELFRVEKQHSPTTDNNIANNDTSIFVKQTRDNAELIGVPANESKS